MRVAIIGGAGFIGVHMVAELQRRGHVVRVLGRSEAPRRVLPRGVSYLRAALTDNSALATALAGQEAVVHLASSTVPATAERDPLADLDANLLGTVNLLEMMANAGPRRLLFLSSGGTVYGVPQRLPVAEDHPLAPTGPYGIVKATIERYLDHYTARRGLSCLSVRASNPYGPMQGNLGVQGIIGSFLQRLQEGQTLDIWGDGSVVRDFIHVSDLAAFCALALESGRVGAYNCGSGEGTAVGAIPLILARVTGLPVTVRHLPGRALDVPVSVLDVTRARQDFGWHAQIALAEGIGQTWAALQAEHAPLRRLRLAAR